MPVKNRKHVLGNFLQYHSSAWIQAPGDGRVPIRLRFCWTNSIKEKRARMLKGFTGK